MRSVDIARQFACIFWILLVFAGCGESGENRVEDGDHSSGDADTESEDEAWDPGENPADECGYGSGYGSCADPFAEGCDQDPCVFGTCEEIGGQASCTCWEGYAGDLCDTCAEGYIVRGLRCVAYGPCEEIDCVYGTCVVINERPVCDCLEGYAGDFCDECAPGYVERDLKCVAEDAE